MNPQFADEEAVNPFDLWAGANFKLKIRQVEGYRNYDKSEFDSPSALSEDDEELERIWKQEYSLQEFLDAKEFKSYDELKRKLAKVLAEDDGMSSRAESQEFTIEDNQEEAPAPRQKASPPPSYAADDDEDDDSLEFFKNLANR